MTLRRDPDSSRAGGPQPGVPRSPPNAGPICDAGPTSIIPSSGRELLQAGPLSLEAIEEWRREVEPGLCLPVHPTRRRPPATCQSGGMAGVSTPGGTARKSLSVSGLTCESGPACKAWAPPQRDYRRRSPSSPQATGHSLLLDVSRGRLFYFPLLDPIIRARCALGFRPRRYRYNKSSGNRHELHPAR